ncbi:Protein-S-isoprenylcysteine O-methyltransferase Ste14 [Terriglobus roseus]|uniref:Protein-S-isoprenylcysteine O-methyltransferase Ste14 n=1 Tax=Terriglobus roseus TaxID=392734 RepID=A0A1G7QHX6_9BACT|nr:Protein-S-isoprenylcysteine O-methyltransferase Ste14 [Terriglobus roseus]
MEMGKGERLVRRIRVPLGFVFAALFLWLARPSFLSLALSLLLVVPGLWLRGYAAGYVKKNAELTQTGPYAYTRNPLYLGSVMAAFGFAFASRRWELVVLLALLFVVIYGPVILSEERFLRGHFADFDEYASRVPRLLPRFTPAPAPAGQTSAGFDAERYKKHREYNSVMGAAGIYATLLVLMWVRAHWGMQ